MLTAQLEPWNGGPADLRTIIGEHYADLSLHREAGFPLAPQWHEYARRDAQGGLIYATLRRDGILVGYIIIFLCPGLHYATCLTAMTDIFFIKWEERGGTGALRLFRLAEREVRRRHADLWIVGHKAHTPEVGRLLEAFGLRQADILYHKWLGESPAKPEGA